MRNFLLCACFILACASTQAQYPDLSTYTIDAPRATSFDYACDTWDDLSFSGCKDAESHCHMESPPWIIGGGGNWRGYFMNDGSNSYECSAPLDIISNDHIDIRKKGTGPTMVSSRTGPFPCSSPSGQDWRRNYYGIWSAQYIDHPVQGAISLGFLHAENKLDCSSGCPGTIFPQQPSYGSSYCPIDFAPTYASFVCAAWTPNDANNNWGQQYFSNDMGPITWPSAGYMFSSGQKSSKGTMSPSSIQYNGYIYVFYHDVSNYTAPGDPQIQREEGRRGGIKVVRALIGDALNPYAWHAFYEDHHGNEHWNPSLPRGFKKEEIQNFLRVPGPLASNLMGKEENSIEERFSVARIKNTDYFIGIESYLKNGRWGKALRYSSDLVHWTGRVKIIEDVDHWSQSDLCYPIFLSKDGWSNTLIDGDDFYILGTGPKITNIVNKVHVYTTAPTGGSNLTGLSASIYQNSVAVRAPAILQNPGQGVFRLVYSLNNSARTQIRVMDMTGRKVLSGEPISRLPGEYSELIDISSRAKGVYLVELFIDGERKTFKILYG